MNLKFKNIASIVLLTMMLTACQKQQQINQEDPAQSFLDWTHLQQITLEQLKAQQYGTAVDQIRQMMILAGTEHDRWEYIRMALVSMPDDLASPLIEEALQMRFVRRDAEQLFGFSRVNTQLKKHPQALELINQAIGIEKKERFVYWRARLYLLLENEQLASEDYQWLLSKDPRNDDYIGQYATLLNYLNKSDEAIELLENNIESPGLLYRKIVLLLQNGNEQQAAEDYAQLAALTQTHELTETQMLEMGELAMWMEAYDDSIRLLSQVSSGELLAESRLLLGRVYMQQGNDDRAAVVFRQVQNGPEQHAIPAYQFEIELNRRQARYDDALMLVNRALKLFPEQADLLYSRAMLYEQQDRLADVERDLRAIISNNPDHADALNALGYTWAERGINLEEAYEYIMQAYELNPESKAIQDSVGWIYYQKGELSQAEKYLRMAIKDNLQDEETYQHLVIVLKALGKHDEASELELLKQELFPES
ncbi:tetratricopeptide repeat protein [Marinicella sediminis]|uniref:Tetratricopeptide repeat protein n=1 Tax=Marinicella sediminis TaxID=1792834 RepID=A0ABV7JCC7_9GAMM|nr:tetratricopeptide repeat protein [Marinicella sediminis]